MDEHPAEDPVLTSDRSGHHWTAVEHVNGQAPFPACLEGHCVGSGTAAWRDIETVGAFPLHDVQLFALALLSIQEPVGDHWLGSREIARRPSVGVVRDDVGVLAPLDDEEVRGTSVSDPTGGLGERGQRESEKRQNQEASFLDSRAHSDPHGAATFDPGARVYASRVAVFACETKPLILKATASIMTPNRIA